ncbi:flagellar protein FlaG [Pseudomonas oryzihabitans]|uniref:Flagellar protein FlaG n=1 Tax=Pseudomonas oryzihabitans TaxID=47885 RepID=A0A1G5P0Y4_9PSED|nr:MULTISPECIES: flagellar protein FlaG [Pseudomonas]NMY91155.1 flagellar protein FlaG [Pseudomonas psychrotolerans]SCZ42751.1 flagellar protein FlaG [Pseudomonas psychrotolerans]
MDIVKTSGFAAVPASGVNLGGNGVAAVSPPGKAAATEQDKAQKSSADVKQDDVESAVSGLKSKLQNDHRNLDFSVDDSTGEVVVKVIDGESGKLVRQIPTEEVLKLSKQLDDFRSLMFEAKA